MPAAWDSGTTKSRVSSLRNSHQGGFTVTEVINQIISIISCHTHHTSLHPPTSFLLWPQHWHNSYQHYYIKTLRSPQDFFESTTLRVLNKFVDSDLPCTPTLTIGKQLFQPFINMLFTTWKDLIHIHGIN